MSAIGISAEMLQLASTAFKGKAARRGLPVSRWSNQLCQGGFDTLTIQADRLYDYMLARECVWHKNAVILCLVIQRKAGLTNAVARTANMLYLQLNRCGVAW